MVKLPIVPDVAVIAPVIVADVAVNAPAAVTLNGAEAFVLPPIFNAPSAPSLSQILSVDPITILPEVNEPILAFNADKDVTEIAVAVTVPV